MKNATINPTSWTFPYVATVPLNYEKLENNPEWITKI